MYTFDLKMPYRILFGNGKLASLGEVIKGYGNKICLVTGSNSLEAGGNLSKIEKSLSACGKSVITLKTYDEPTVDFIDKSCDALKREAPDLIIGIGGGSSMDTAKMLSVMLCNKGSVSEYIDNCAFNGSSIPVIAIPTIASTGSEVTSRAVISDFSAEPFKTEIQHISMMPALTIIDPEIAVGNSPQSLKYSSVNILGQLIQCYVSQDSNRLTDILMLDAIKSVFTCINNIADKQPDEFMHEKLAYASMISGFGVENSSLTAINGIANAIGGLYNIPHSEITSVLLYPCSLINMRRVQFFESFVETTLKYAQVGSILSGIEYSYDKKDVLLRAVSEGLMDISKKCAVPSLSQFGIKKEDFYKIITHVKQGGNPIELADTEINEILESCY